MKRASRKCIINSSWKYFGILPLNDLFPQLSKHYIRGQKKAQYIMITEKNEKHTQTCAHTEWARF